MLSQITIGQYFPTGSPLHKLDPSAKIFLCLLMLVTVFLANNPWTLGLCVLVTLALCLLSKVRLTMYLRMLKAILPVVLLTAVLNALYGEGDAIVSFWIFRLTAAGIQRAIFLTVRIVLLIWISSLLTYTTSPTELTDGMERLMSPLRWVGLGEAVHVLAMMTSIALRFIPILLEETDKILSAQKARGADMESGNLFQRVRAMLPVLIPLLISATRRAIDLADAMESRCYHGGAGRTKMNQHRPGLRDGIALLAVVCLMAAVIVGRVLL